MSRNKYLRKLDDALKEAILQPNINWDLVQALIKDGANPKMVLNKAVAFSPETLDFILTPPPGIIFKEPLLETDFNDALEYVIFHSNEYKLIRDGIGCVNIQKLIKAGANPAIVLNKAVEYSPEILDLILTRHNDNTYKLDKEIFNGALKYTISQFNVQWDSIQKLIKAGANPVIALNQAVIYSPETLDLILTRHNDNTYKLDQKNLDDALKHAISQFNVKWDTIQKLIKAGANPVIALNQAVIYSSKTLDLILSNKLDQTILDNALQYAVANIKYNNTQEWNIILKLIKAGASPVIALNQAVRYSPETLNFILTNHKLDQTSLDGALEYAVSYSTSDSAKKLIEAGANPEIIFQSNEFKILNSINNCFSLDKTIKITQDILTIAAKSDKESDRLKYRKLLNVSDLIIKRERERIEIEGIESSTEPSFHNEENGKQALLEAACSYGDNSITSIVIDNCYKINRISDDKTDNIKDIISVLKNANKISYKNINKLAELYDIQDIAEKLVMDLATDNENIDLSLLELEELIDAGVPIKLTDPIKKAIKLCDNQSNTISLLSIFSNIYSDKTLNKEFSDHKYFKTFLNLRNKVEKEVENLARYCDKHSKELDRNSRINNTADKIVKIAQSIYGGGYPNTDTVISQLRYIIENKSSKILDEYNNRPSWIEKLIQTVGDKIKKLFLTPKIFDEKKIFLENENTHTEYVKQVDDIIDKIMKACRKQRKNGIFSSDEIKIIKEIANNVDTLPGNIDKAIKNIDKIMGYANIREVESIVKKYSETKNFCFNSFIEKSEERKEFYYEQSKKVSSLRKSSTPLILSLKEKDFTYKENNDELPIATPIEEIPIAYVVDLQPSAPPLEENNDEVIAYIPDVEPSAPPPPLNSQRLVSSYENTLGNKLGNENEKTSHASNLQASKLSGDKNITK